MGHTQKKRRFIREENQKRTKIGVEEEKRSHAKRKVIKKEIKRVCR